MVPHGNLLIKSPGETNIQGFPKVFSISERLTPDAKFHLVNQELGKTFEILRTSTKPHACCRYMQAPIDGLTELAITHDLHSEQVSRVEIAVLEAGWPLVCEPQQRKYSPSSIVDAQFSMPFAAALALCYRQAGLDQFTDENLKLAQL